MSNANLAAEAVASRVLALAGEYGDGLAQVSSLSATMASLDFDTPDALELIMAVEDEFGVTLGGPFDEGDEPDGLLDMPLQAVVDAAVKALVAAHRIEPSGRDLFCALPKVRFALPVHAYLGGCRHLGGGEFVGIHPSVTLDRISKIPLLMKRASPVLEMCMPNEPADVVTRFTMASYDDPFDRQPKTFSAVAFADDEAGNPLVIADDPEESIIRASPALQATSATHRVKIEGDGTSGRTRIVDATTGEALRFVQGYTITQRAGELAKAVIDVSLPKVELECDAELRVAADPEADKGAKVLALVRAFVEKHRISCPETIHQADRVIEKAGGLVEKLCDVAGYYRDPDDDPFVTWEKVK